MRSPGQFSPLFLEKSKVILRYGGPDPPYWPLRFRVKSQQTAVLELIMTVAGRKDTDWSPALPEAQAPATQE